MKKRVSIYIDDVVWGEIKDRAWEARVSASKYLEDLVTGKNFVPNPVLKPSFDKPVEKSSADRIREKPDMTIEDLAAKQAELDAEKAKRNIKEDKIAKVREVIGYSKAAQLGKRA